jgi:hypothetical protein
VRSPQPAPEKSNIPLGISRFVPLGIRGLNGERQRSIQAQEQAQLFPARSRSEVAVVGGPLRGNRVVRVDPNDPIAVSRARAAIAGWYDSESRRRYGSPSSSGIPRVVAIRIDDFERYFAHRYGHVVPCDDAGREDLVILANHIAQNRNNPAAKIVRAIRSWASWMPVSAAEAIADEVLKKPRWYKAVTLGALLRLTREEKISLSIRTIRPFDMSDAEVKEDRKRRDRESKAANRAANRSGRPRGRPKSEGAKVYELLGIPKATYYRRRKKAAMIGTNSETKNVSAILEDNSYTADTFSVSRPNLSFFPEFETLDEAIHAPKTIPGAAQ